MCIDPNRARGADIQYRVMTLLQSSHAVPGSQVAVDVLIGRQVFHPTGYLGTHDHQPLANFHYLPRQSIALHKVTK